jgi:hypothetical protein
VSSGFGSALVLAYLAVDLPVDLPVDRAEDRATTSLSYFPEATPLPRFFMAPL